MTRTVYSYIRFSAKKQERGDSLRRQTEMRDRWLARHPDAVLDDSLKADLGRSAWKGEKQKELLSFLDRIARGDIRPGSVLLVEKIDRISRQGVDEGYELLKKILRAGVHIVTLSPEREFGPDAVKGLMQGALELQIMLEQAKAYSDTISQRVGESYDHRRKKARTGQGLSANVLPAWCKLDGRRVVLDGPKADAVRRVFELAAGGYGAGRIARKLTEENVIAIGRRAVWHRGYVIKLIRDRRVLGEYAPTAKGKPTGEVIADYFPRVVDDRTYHRARAGATDRRHHGGRPSGGDVTNLFVGLARNALTGESMLLQHNHNRSGPRTAVLVDGGFERNDWVSFPYWPFERMIRSRLLELDATKVLNTGDCGAADELRALEAERDEVRRRLAEIAEQLASRAGKGATLALAADRLEERERLLTEAIRAAEARASRPLLSAWRDAHELLAREEAGHDREDVRTRLRSALRGIIDRMTMLVVARGIVKLAAVQIDFKAGGRRHYLLCHRRQYFNFKATVPAVEAPLSLTDAEFLRPAARAFDLRDPADARALEAVLNAIDLENLFS